MKGNVKSNEWLIEELIEPDIPDKVVPYDLKVYCFYGKTPLVTEVCRYPEG